MITRILWLFYLAPRHNIGFRVSLNEQAKNSADLKNQIGEYFGTNKQENREIQSVILKRDGWWYGFTDGDVDASKDFRANLFYSPFDWRWFIPVLIAVLGLLVNFVQSDAGKAFVGAILQQSAPTQTFISTVIPTETSSPTPTTTQTPSATAQSPTGTVWDFDRTKKAEESAKMIWIVTPDLHWDFDDPVWSKIIFDNMAKGKTRYHYLYLRSDSNNKKVAEIERDLRLVVGDKLVEIAHFIPIDSKDFTWYLEYIFYDAYDRYQSNGYAIAINSNGPNPELVPEMALRFREQFIKIWNDNVTDIRWRLLTLETQTPTPEQATP